MLTFIASCAGSYSGKTLTSYFYAIRAWHVIHGQTWVMNNIEMKAVLTGAANLAPPTSTKPKCAPWKVELLKALFGILDPNNPLHIAVKAAVATIFFSAARSGEFLQKNTYLIQARTSRQAVRPEQKDRPRRQKSDSGTPTSDQNSSGGRGHCMGTGARTRNRSGHPTSRTFSDQRPRPKWAIVCVAAPQQTTGPYQIRIHEMH